MANRLLVPTRKGLFTLGRDVSASSGWSIIRNDFLGDNVSVVLPDARDGRICAALDHGHFGVKMHRWTNGDWEELPAPA